MSARALALFAGLFAASALAAGPALVPVKAFARRASFEDAKISPTGQYLAVSIPYGEQTALGILDIKNLKITGTLRFSHGEHVDDFHWVGPERVIVEIANREGPLDQRRLTGELYAMNADGSNKKYLFGHRGSEQIGTHIGTATKAYGWSWVLDPLPHDPQRALVWVTEWSENGEIRNPLIELLDVFSGVRRHAGIVQGFPELLDGSLAAVTDATGRLRFAVSRDENERHLLLAADPGPLGWKRVEPPDGAAETIALHSASPDGQSVYLTTESAKGRACLREFRFDAGFTDLACADGGHVGSPVLAIDDRRPIGLLSGNGEQVEYLDEKHPDARLQMALRKAFGAQRITVTSTTLDKTKAVIFVDSDRNPGDYFLVDRQTKKADYLISHRNWIDPAKMTPVQSISYKARDGVTIHGYLTAPAGKETRKAPLVLMPHGGPHGVRDEWAFNPEAQLFASRGYAVLQSNFRGSGGYGIQHERAGYRKWATLMQDDLTDAVRWAIDAGIADKNRVCIFGSSYGGYAALMSPLREPDLYRCAISFAGVYDLIEQADDSDAAEQLLGRKYLTRVLGDDKVKAEQSPVTHIEKLKIPVFIAHGTSDKRVRFSQAKILRKALEKHKKTYEWMEFQGEEHGFYDDKNHEAFLTKSLEFLDKHIGAGAAAPK